MRNILYSYKKRKQWAPVTVTFKNYDGTVLETKTVPWWGTPTYTGATPIKPAYDNDNPYHFSWWDTPLWPVVTDTIYTAKFRSKRQWPCPDWFHVPHHYEINQAVTTVLDHFATLTSTTASSWISLLNSIWFTDFSYYYYSPCWSSFNTSEVKLRTNDTYDASAWPMPFSAGLAWEYNSQYRYYNAFATQEDSMECLQIRPAYDNQWISTSGWTVVWQSPSDSSYKIKSSWDWLLCFEGGSDSVILADTNITKNWETAYFQWWNNYAFTEDELLSPVGTHQAKVDVTWYSYLNPYESNIPAMFNNSDYLWMIEQGNWYELWWWPNPYV